MLHGLQSKGVRPSWVTPWSCGDFQQSPFSARARGETACATIVSAPSILPGHWLENLSQNCLEVLFRVFCSQDRTCFEWKIYIFFLFPLKTKWQKPKHFGQMCGKNSFGSVANGLWESLLGCLMPLLSSPSCRMTVSPEMHCGDGSALASLQRRESEWGKSLAPGASSGGLLYSNTFGPYEQISKFQISRFLFQGMKRGLRR